MENINYERDWWDVMTIDDIVHLYRTQRENMLGRAHQLATGSGLLEQKDDMSHDAHNVHSAEWGAHPSPEPANMSEWGAGGMEAGMGGAEGLEFGMLDGRLNSIHVRLPVVRLYADAGYC